MANSNIPLDVAQIVGLFMESVFYGIFLVSFCCCTKVLVWSDGSLKSLRILNVKMLIASLVMFMVASLDVAFHLRHNLQAFVWSKTTAIGEFNKTSSWINVVKMGCYVAQTFVGDSILIFRCWVVYNRNWPIIFVPISLWLGTTACGILSIEKEATLTSGQLINSTNLVPFVTSMLCLTLATNVITTSLIVHRIWKVRGEIGKDQIFLSNSPLTNVAIILIESGLMYTFSIVVLFGLYLTSNNGQYGVSNSIVQIIGITFNLVIASVGRRESGVSGTCLPVGSRPSQQGGPHTIKIQTTIDRYADGPLTFKGFDTSS